jgi:signal transduction histidine kinase
MSHELRTPLNSVLGFAQLLESPPVDPLTERQRRYIGHIRSQGQHLLELINDVLDLSRVAAGQLPMAHEDVDLDAIVAGAVARIGPLAQAKHQEVRVQVEKGAVANADRLRVTQAVMNLLSNAVKFTPDGGEIGISVARRGKSYAVVVTDDGPGIAPDDQLIAFDEFSKLSAGRRGEGTGLGLSLTRRLVEAMGGSVSLESELTKGATFTIELPAA